MKNEICIDSGIFSIFFSNTCTHRVLELMAKVKNGDLTGQLISPLVCEIYYHACKVYGQDQARILLNSTLVDYCIEIIDPDKSLLFMAGLLKCQHRTTLSYNDCLAIAYCLNMKLEFHTTEKKLKEIPGNVLQKLKTVKYELPK
jgi:predicted nucleic acid-binding protein